MRQGKRAFTDDWKRRLRTLRPLVLIFCVVLSVFIALGSTMAWFTAGDTMRNPIKTPLRGFLVELIDIFTKPEHFLVGERIPKVVGAANKDTKPGFISELLCVGSVTAHSAIRLVNENAGSLFTNAPYVS